MMKCGECTLCCELLDIKSVDSKAGEMCKHCDKGCMIYNKRPNECKTFNCAYLQMENVGKELRPDKCGIIFEKITDNIFLGTMDKDTKIKPIVKQQIEYFVKDGFAVILNKTNGLRKIFETKTMKKQDIINAINKKYGST